MGKRNRAKDDKQLLLTRAKAAVEDICAVNAQRVVVFSGSGISKASGMSTFSDPGACACLPPAAANAVDGSLTAKACVRCVPLPCPSYVPRVHSSDGSLCWA